MAQKPRLAKRALALLLAAMMAVSSFQVTTYAADSSMTVTGGSAGLIDDPLSGETGSGWDNIEVIPPVDEGTENPDEGEKPDPEPEGPEEGENPDSENPGGGEGSGTDSEVPGEGENPEVPEEGEKPETDPENPDQNLPETPEGGEQPDQDLPEGNGQTPAVPGEGTAPPAVNGVELPWAANLRAAAEATMAMPVPLGAGDGGGGVVEFTPYNWGGAGDGSNLTWIGGYYFYADLYRITYDGEDAFCAEFNGQQPGGNYVQDSEGNDEQIKKILASYEASSKNRADYIAAQSLIWAELLSSSVTDWGASGANEDLLDPDADTSNVRYWIYTNTDVPHTQNIIVYTIDDPLENPYAFKIIKKSEEGATLSGATFSVTGPDGFNRTGLKTNNKGEILVYIDKTGEYTVTETAPPTGFQLSDTPSQKVTVTEANKQDNPAEVTFVNPKGEDTPDGDIVTEVHQSKTYEYSDAIGQITIRKEDQDGRPLDGAQFKITVKFSDGSEQVTEGWEVDGGSRLFTWTHPENNHDPATVIVEETKAPKYYELDPTPKTETVSPTYTRVTHVETWTVTIVTNVTIVTVQVST